jgi:hypothetical protein
MSVFKKFISKIIKKIFYEEIEKILINKGKILSLKQSKFKKIKNISDVEFRVFSQWGEDGIIDWVINQIPNISKNFIEIGTEDFKEANTRFLLMNKNWDGVLIEGDKNYVENIKKDRIYWKHNIKVINEFVNLSNIDNIISNLKLKKEIGLISLDIDGIDYWILKKLKLLKPGIFICEFNPLFGYEKSLTVPYKKKFIRSKEHYSNSYFGASLRAIIKLLNKEYLFIGTNSAGNNAFFINKRHSKYIKNNIINKKIFKSKFRESRNKIKKLNYLSSKENINTIKNKKLFDLEKNKILKIEQIFNEKK